MANLRNQMQALGQGIVTSERERKMAVAESKAQTVNMLQAFGRERAAMRRDLSRRLAQSTEATAASVVALRAGLNKAHRHMAKAQHAGLAKNRRDRSWDVAELMNGFHLSHGEMARDLAEALGRSTQKIKSQVSGLNGFRSLLEKARKSDWFPRQIPNSLLAVQASGAAPVPVLAPSRAPAKHTKRPVEKTTSAGKAIRAFVRNPGKPKKK